MASTQTIRFSLKENKLVSNGAAPYVASVHGYKTLGQEEIISIMAGKNASVSRQEILVVLDLMKAVIRDILLAGDRVSTDLFNARVSIGGGFESADGEYQAEKHSVNVRLVPSVFLKREVEARARVEKIRSRKSAPELDSVYDYATLARNASVTSGNTAEIRGDRLDCDGGDEAQGVFFVNKAADTEVKAAVVHRKSRSRIVFRVPELAPGTYGLVLRRSFGSEIREGRLEAEISVN